MASNILKLFIEKGFLLDKEMLDFLDELGDEGIAREIVNKIAIVSQKKVITKNLVNENIDKIKPLLFELDDEKKKLVDKYFVNVSISVEVENEEDNQDSDSDISKVIDSDEHKNSVKILSSPVIASQKLEVRDFVKYFRSRYNVLKNILQQRPDLDGLISIDKITGNRDLSIIGLITEKHVTKNKNIILTVEDLTGKAKLLINQNKEEIYEKAKEILLDDVIGFKCNGSRDFLFVNDFFYPECFLKDKKRLDEEVYALFTSDFHIGSGNFLEKNFDRFIKWLNGEGCDSKQKDVLKKIRYMFVTGDSIDGVGIYPGQEKDLLIKDIREQYVKLAEYYKRIPKHISIIQCAGQHDGVRVAEPQPPIGEDFGAPLHEFDNLHLVSNPSLIEVGGGIDKSGKSIEGFKVLMYHGASMHNVINEIEELRLANAHSTPARVVKHLLLRRHLAPTHGATTYIPDKNEDSMLIKEIPDIVATGDLHKPDIDTYNNVLIISSSCWQAMTAFEEKVGNQPDPCKVPILNLKTREIRMLDFSDPEESEMNSDSCNVAEKVCEDVKEDSEEVSEVNKKEIVCGVTESGKEIVLDKKENKISPEELVKSEENNKIKVEVKK
jgi:DNA polymerase II small subunit